MSLMKSTCLTLAVAGCLTLPHAADAAIVAHGVAANAPAHCQAFTPGPTNTIRNRVVGAENVGTATMSVACTFEKTGALASTGAIDVSLYFSNNGVAPITVNCTMVSGWQGMSGATVINHSVIVNPGVQSHIAFTPDDTADPADVALNSVLVGVNCSLPSHGVINDTYMTWLEDDGIGT